MGLSPCSAPHPHLLLKYTLGIAVAGSITLDSTKAQMVFQALSWLGFGYCKHLERNSVILRSLSSFSHLSPPLISD